MAGKLSVSPDAGGQWQLKSSTSHPSYGSAANTIIYANGTFVAGTTYTIAVTDLARDKFDRPFAANTWTLRYKLYGSPGLALSVSPSAPTAGSLPTFSWNSSDTERFEVTVTKSSITQWASGIRTNGATSISYGSGAGYTSLSTGAYIATVVFRDGCNVAQNSATVGFSVP